MVYVGRDLRVSGLSRKLERSVKVMVKRDYGRLS